MRSNPTSPLYLYLAIGSLGTNIARYTGIRRLGGHLHNVLRSGCFYNFLAPSRYGKGAATRFTTKIGNYIESLRNDAFAQFLTRSLAVVQPRSKDAEKKITTKCKTLRPSSVFLTGANVIQTKAAAASNGGCGLILVSEIKNGKGCYTDMDGTYGTFLNFYDPDMAAESFRNAEDIPRIDKCRIQMIAAGVKEDWIQFVEKSGIRSGMMARVLPVLSFGRDFSRLGFERLPKHNFSMEGLKKVLAIMEETFQRAESTDELSPVTIQFSQSELDEEYRDTNKLLISPFTDRPVTDYRGVVTTLLDNAPPGTEELEREAKGEGLLTVYREQITAEFTPLIQTPADLTFIRGLEDNLLRIAADFFWAYKLTSYLSKLGVLTDDKEVKMRNDLNEMIRLKVVTYPQGIIPNLLSFVTYVIKGTFLLNRLAAGHAIQAPVQAPHLKTSRKRYRLVKRLSEGYGRQKKRRFFYSKLDSAIAEITTQEMEQQLRILKARAIVSSPSHRSVELNRQLSEAATLYLKQHCEYTDEDLAQLIAANTLLID